MDLECVSFNFVTVFYNLSIYESHICTITISYRLLRQSILIIKDELLNFDPIKALRIYYLPKSLLDCANRLLRKGKRSGKECTGVKSQVTQYSFDSLFNTIKQCYKSTSTH